MAIAFLLMATLAPGRGFADVDEDERFTVVLPDYPSQPITVRLPQDEGGLLTAFATGFVTEDHAYQAGRQIQSAIRAACMTTGMAIDVGTVAKLRSALSAEVRHEMEQKAVELGEPRRVVNHVHGVQVFDDRGWPVRYFHTSATGFVHADRPGFVDAITSQVARQTALRPPDAKVETARDLFMAADIEVSSRSKFLILVTALEVLAVRHRRSDELQRHIDHLVELTKVRRESATDRSGIDGLLNSLHREREQSITSAIKELAASAPGYGDEAGETARRAADCYEARSRIVHDGVEPEGFDINADMSWVRSLVHALVLPKP
jgi:hypothetical protein